MGVNMGGRTWTAKEQSYLARYWVRNLRHPDGVARLAQKLERTDIAIVKKAQEMGLRRNVDGIELLNVRQLAEYLGVSESSIKKWRQRGRMRSEPINYDALLEWLEDPRHWHLWRPEGIADRQVGEYYAELRADWFDVVAAASAIGTTRNYLRNLIYSGKVIAIRHASGAWVHRYEAERWHDYMRTGTLAAYREPPAVERVAGPENPGLGGWDQWFAFAAESKEAEAQGRLLLLPAEGWEEMGYGIVDTCSLEGSLY